MLWAPHPRHWSLPKIGSDGTVTVTQPNQSQSQQIGQIQLATFPNPGGLNSVGANLQLPTSSSGDPIVGIPGGPEGLGTLMQGSLELPRKPPRGRRRPEKIIFALRLRSRSSQPRPRPKDSLKAEKENYEFSHSVRSA